MSNQINLEKPIFDGFESLDETVQWISEPIDILARSERLALAASKSPAFKSYIDLVFNPKLSFEEALMAGEFNVKPVKLGRWGYVPYSKLMSEIHRYSNYSSLLPRFRLNQLIGCLDDTYPPDGKHLIGMVKGEDTLPDKLNIKVYKLAFPRTEESVSGEVSGTTSAAESC